MRSADFDWVGLWYVVGKERGLNDVFSLARLNTATGNVEWHDFSHSLVDGIGAMGNLQRQMGYQLPVLPASRWMERPPLVKRAKIFWEALRAAGPQRIDWIGGDKTLKPGTHDFPWVVFSREETKLIAEKAKARNVSQSALILEAFNSVLIPRLVLSNRPGMWVFPVNLRGAVSKPQDCANHSSAIAISTDRFTKAEEIHGQIQYGLKSGMHWATWWLLHVGKIVGVRGVRLISRLSEKKSHWYGTFTNMGHWPVSGSFTQELDPDEAWLVTPPGTKNYPVGIGCLTWNSRLAISLKIHPSICADRTLPASLLEETRRKLAPNN